MNRRLIALLALLAVTAVACGSDGASTADTLPTIDTPVSAPNTDAPTPIEHTQNPLTPNPSDPDRASDAEAQAELDAARARWAEQGPDSYTIVTQQLCFCPIEQWSDTVVDGIVTEHVALFDEVFHDPSPRPMDVLFDEVQQAIDDGYASLTLSFDLETGALEQFFVDVDEMMADEEYGIEVISLEPLS